MEVKNKEERSILEKEDELKKKEKEGRKARGRDVWASAFIRRRRLGFVTAFPSSLRNFGESLITPQLCGSYGLMIKTVNMINICRLSLWEKCYFSNENAGSSL